jgi:hypothetical protein
MQGTSLAGHSILIVEDEALIALDIQMAFERQGQASSQSTLSPKPSLMWSRMVYQVRCLITACAVKTAMLCASG